MDAIKQSFVAKSREQERKLKDRLLQMENGGENPDNADAIFQCAHTIYCDVISAQSESNSLNCESIVEFMYVMVNVLDELRSDSFKFNLELVELLLACADYLGVLTECLERDRVPDDTQNEGGRSLLNWLQNYSGNSIVSGNVLGEKYRSSELKLIHEH